MQAQKNLDAKVRYLLSVLEESDDFDFTALGKTYESLRAEKKSLIDEYFVTGRIVFEKMNDLKNEHDNYLNTMARQVGLDLDLLLDKWESEAREKGRKLIINYGNRKIFRENQQIARQFDAASKKYFKSSLMT